MIDTHCHIDDLQFADELEQLVLRQQEAGVEAILVPGVNQGSLSTVPAVCSRYPGFLYPALGLHPEDVGGDYRQVLLQIRDLIDHYAERFPDSSKLVAIGEIGLDYHFSTEFKEVQKEAFRQQLQWAVEMDMPVMVHARDAAEDTLRIIKDYWINSGKKLRGVMHCFSGSREIAEEYIKMGWYLGIGGVLTFKNCKLPEILRTIPLEALVLETDAPYMAPVPFRGKPNESRYLDYVAAKLADVYGLEKSKVISVTNESARRLFRLK